MADRNTTNQHILARLADIAHQRDDLARALEDPSVLADHAQVRDLSIRKAALDPVADGYNRYTALTTEAQELRNVLNSPTDHDADLIELATEELPRLEREADELLTSILESLVHADDQAVGSVMLEIRAGVGGDEAGLWADDLLTMYRRLADTHAWKTDDLAIDRDEGLGGLRSCVINVRGSGVWSTLQHEAGTHCVKRVPATESQGRVHTSTATVAVLPEPEELDVTIDSADVDEHITTAQGPGGQNVNKVATAVHLIHNPTGVEVRMQETKSQAQNREKAWRLLRARVYEIELEKTRAAESAARAAQIGSAARSERIRTYRWKDNIAVDHRVNESFPLQDVLAGRLDALHTALHARETERRLSEL